MLGKGNQGRVKDCSTVAVFLSDLQADKRINRIQQLENGKRHPTYVAMMPITSAFLLGQGHAATLLKQITTDLASNLQPMPGIDPILAWSYKNTALAVQSYVFAAQSHELATCIMEGFDPRRVADILDIPHRYGIPMMVATGYEREDMKGQATPRLDVSEIVFGESFGVPYGDDNDKTNVQEGDDKEMSA